MSKLQRLSKKAPEGWNVILDSLEMFENRMKDAVNESHEGKRKHESKWPIHRINYERTRYVYELHYTKKEISRELVDFCIREKVVDGNLMAKWKKPGYEFLCSVAAINKGSTNFGTTSVCRVPLRLRGSPSAHRSRRMEQLLLKRSHCSWPLGAEGWELPPFPRVFSTA